MIDIHAHVVLEHTFGCAGPHGPELIEAGNGSGALPCFRVGGYELHGVAYRGSAFMDPEVRLEAMDHAGIDRQVLSPNPLTYFSHVEPEWAVGYCERHNDELAALVGNHGDRLAGFAQLPTQDPSLAAVELERAVSELGLVGAYIGTDLGRPLDDPTMAEIYSACEELDVPLFFHPTVDGIDRPRRDERLARFDGDLWMGFCFEETLAVAVLVLGGVLDRHPSLDVCMSHGGGAMSWLAERMAHAAATRSWADERLREEGAIDARLRRIWWDTHVGGPVALASLRVAFGDDRLVGGTNLAGWDETSDPSAGDAALAERLVDNARRLLRFGPGVPERPVV